MASTTLKLSTLLTIITSLTTINLQLSTAGDPDILSDFILPPGVANPPDASFFTFTAFRSLLEGSNLTTYNTFTAIKATMAEFPALNGQSVSLAALRFPSATANPPHTHPRAAELLFLVSGALEVGVVDTTNKLFTRTLRAGDMFVFPKGLVHFQYNAWEEAALGFSAFGSANAGLVSLPATLFGTEIDDEVLAKGFKTDVDTVRGLKAGLATKH
ncbi:unnamed protein product [Linum tenue]|uniref:Germin-like protein n=1 Tax=Linum tenue TaxID=586396 RepID=A0AAV0QGP0_9ROSI|nr:unnamed protein product [Linum tenue]